ncbi:MAG: hypothetical protein ACRDKT_10920 [Actinomycetota bacterium]
MDLISRRIAASFRSLGLLAAIAVVVLAGVPAASDEAGAPAQVVDIEPPSRIERYRVTDFGRSPSARDDRTSFAKFRVVERTGNCCENYLTSNSKGVLYDLGGSYINFTKDRGKTWKSVRPINPLVNGEGTIAVAPGGDIIGVEWDPYSADHLLSYKYTAETKTWEYLEMPLHTPFYDRPWLAVVPGPFAIRGAQEEVPYVVFVDGFPHRGTFLYSTDGLTYVETSNPFLDQRLQGAVDKLKVGKAKDMDWIQTNSESPIVPLGGKSALAQPGPFANSWAVFNGDTQTWSALEGLDLEGRFQVDSRGRLHNFIDQGRSFIYQISTDDGKSWKSVKVELTDGTSYTSDFRVNSSLGVAAVSIHVDGTKADRDVLYRFDITGNKPRLERLYEIGKGDVDASSGVGQDIRMDFNTVTILPDGKLAISFLDSTTGPVFHLQEPINPERLGPAMAIEL